MTEELDILETYVAAIYKADQTIRDNILVDKSVMGRQIRWFYTNNSSMDKNRRPHAIYRHVIFCKDWRKIFVLGNYEPRRWLMPYGIATHTINGDVYLSKNMHNPTASLPFSHEPDFVQRIVLPLKGILALV